MILTEFAAKNGFMIYDIYIDDADIIGLNHKALLKY